MAWNVLMAPVWLWETVQWAATDAANVLSSLRTTGTVSCKILKDEPPSVGGGRAFAPVIPAVAKSGRADGSISFC